MGTIGQPGDTIESPFFIFLMLIFALIAYQLIMHGIKGIGLARDKHKEKHLAIHFEKETIEPYNQNIVASDENNTPLVDKCVYALLLCIYGTITCIIFLNPSQNQNHWSGASFDSHLMTIIIISFIPQIILVITACLICSFAKHWSLFAIPSAGLLITICAGTLDIIIHLNLYPINHWVQFIELVLSVIALLLVPAAGLFIINFMYKTTRAQASS